MSASRADAASGSEIAALVARVKTALGRIDIAVTTPGINIRKLILNYSEADFDRIVDLNVKGTFFFEGRDFAARQRFCRRSR